MYLNIKDFRYINESWGEEDGNLMLQFIYRMLSGLINEEELVSRSSMDHFFLLLKEEDDRGGQPSNPQNERSSKRADPL